jgi:hypothetical protein
MRTLQGKRAAVVTFLCGVGLASAFGPDKPPAAPAAAPRASAAEAPATDAAPPPEDWGRTPAGQEWKNFYNGRKLPLPEGLLSERELADARVSVLPSRGTLVAAGNSLLLVGGSRDVVWTYCESQVMIDFAYVEATGVVCGTAGDNTMFILDAETGVPLVRESRDGRAAYGAVLAFGRDQCLVMDDFSGYRSDENFIPPVSDGMMAWRGTKKLWYKDVPPDAEVRTVGDRIFAVTKTATRILVSEIEVPKAGR